MKILCIAFIDPDYPQLYKKLDSQVNGLKNAGHDATGVVLGPHGADMSNYNLHYISHLYDRKFFFRASLNLIETLVPDLIFFRYPLADDLLYQFMLLEGKRVVFEHNTKEEMELSGDVLKNELNFGQKCRALAAGLIGVTHEILLHQQQRSMLRIPGAVISNGRSPKDIQICKKTTDVKSISLICTAHFSKWHGIDRVISGLLHYEGTRNVILHLVGNGEAINSYIDLSSAHSLSSNIFFHGHLNSKEITNITCQCHVAIGSLAHHRKGIREVCALKHREYALQGIPFIYAGIDPDFPPGLPFVHTIPLDDSPVDIDSIVQFAITTHGTKDLQNLEREYAETHINWDVKMGKLSSFFKKILPTDRPAPPPVPLVSVVIPCSDQACFLPEAFRSIARQTWRNFEIVIVYQEASKDTNQIIKKIKLQHPDISSRIVAGKYNCIEEALNIGINASVGQWILALKDEDMYGKEFLELAMQKIHKHPEVNIISCGVQNFGHIKDVWTPPIYNLEKIFEENIIPYGSLYRKSLWREVGGYDPVALFGGYDWNFWLRCSRVGIVHTTVNYFGLLHRTTTSPNNRYSRKAKNLCEEKELNHTAFPEIYGELRVLEAHTRLMKMSDRCREKLQYKLNTYPEHYLPHLWQGLDHEGRGELAESVAAYLRAANLAPDTDWQPFLRLAIINHRIGRKYAANAAMQECITRNKRLSIIFNRVLNPS